MHLAKNSTHKLRRAETFIRNAWECFTLHTKWFGPCPLDRNFAPGAPFRQAKFWYISYAWGWWGAVWQTKVSNGAHGTATQLICALFYGHAFAFCTNTFRPGLAVGPTPTPTHAQVPVPVPAAAPTPDPACEWQLASLDWFISTCVSHQ